MKSSSRLLLTIIAMVALICITGINGQRARPTMGASAPSTGSSTRLPARNTQPQQAAATPSSPVSSDGRRNDHQEEQFTIENLAGTHAFKASGVVLVGGVDSPTYVVGSPTAYPTYPEDLWISAEGRLCINEKGECTINAWVNVGGLTSIHLDTQDPSKCVPAGQQCRATVDEFGQGVVYIPIVLTPDEEAPIHLPHFPNVIVLRFQAFDDDHSYFEIEGCGPKGTIEYSGHDSGLPGWDTTTGTPGSLQLLQYIRHVCTHEQLADQGRRPISLTGESTRINFRCSNCKKDDFAWYGGECSDRCPWDKQSSHGGSSGPRIGGSRNNGGHSLDS